MANPADIETTVERRRAARAPVTVRIHYATVDAMFSEFTRNVNEGGVFVETESPLEMDETVVLQFSLPGVEAPVHARGRVVRVQEPGSGAPAGMAIEFDTLDGSARDAIDRVVRELRSEPE